MFFFLFFLNRGGGVITPLSCPLYMPLALIAFMLYLRVEKNTRFLCILTVCVCKNVGLLVPGLQAGCITETKYLQMELQPGAYKAGWGGGGGNEGNT